MPANATLEAEVRGTSAADYDSGTQAVAMNNRGDLSLAQALPVFAELSRLGDCWSVAIATASAFTPVAAWPSTRSELVLYNGELSGGTGKSYIIDTIWCSCVTTIAAASSFTLLAQISNAGLAGPTNDTVQLITGRCGKVYSGNATRAVADAATYAVANKWTAVGVSRGHPSASIGAGVYAPVYGRFILPPGATLCVNVVASTAVGALICGIDWYEVLLDLG